MIHDYILILQEYSFQITMRQQWNDKRLRYKERLASKPEMEGNIPFNKTFLILEQCAKYKL